MFGRLGPDSLLLVADLIEHEPIDVRVDLGTLLVHVISGKLRIASTGGGSYRALLFQELRPRDLGVRHEG